jgi:hypothetical protein
MNLDAIGRTRNLTYETDEIRYIDVSTPLGDFHGSTVDFFKANTTTLVDITLRSTPGERVVVIFNAADPNNFPNWP